MGIDTRTVTGADKLKLRIATLRATLALPALTDEIGRLLLKRHLTRFDAEKDPDGEPWKALKPSYAARKAREVGPRKLLVTTGEMRKSIQIIRGDDTGTIFTNTGAGIRIGIRNPRVIVRARTHNRGYPRGKVPMRKFLGIGKLDIKAVDSLLRRQADKLERI